MTIGYTEEQVLELITCVKDPIHFIENHVKIYHPTYGLIPFELHPFQKNLVEAYHSGKHTVAVIPRQMGATTTSLAYLLWYACMNVDRTILIGARNHMSGRVLMDKIREMISTMPEGLVPKMRENNRTSIYFENGCRIMFQVLSENFARGMSVNVYYVDELAYASKAGRKWFKNVVFPCLYHAQLIVASTPSPDDSLLPELYDMALNSPEKWNAIRVRWDEFPGRGDEFKEQMKKYMSEAHWKTEYECEFINKETYINKL
jgi:hypothetical protein